MIGTAADTEQDGTDALGDSRADDSVIDGQAPPSMRVVEAIARATGADPAAMPPIYGAVDPDALDRLFDGPADVRVQFEYEELLVEMDSDGRILVDGEHFTAR